MSQTLAEWFTWSVIVVVGVAAGAGSWFMLTRLRVLRSYAGPAPYCPTCGRPFTHEGLAADERANVIVYAEPEYPARVKDGIMVYPGRPGHQYCPTCGRPFTYEGLAADERANVIVYAEPEYPARVKHGIMVYPGRPGRPNLPPYGGPWS